jgi:peptidoglycan/LPS O-acetylase OafA/YrhL
MTKIDAPASPSAAGHGERIESLNGLRAVSVFLVIASHLATSDGTPRSLAPVFALFNGLLFDGALGVNMFFCISGFLITYLLLRERAATGGVALGRFYLRRCLRIWPVFYAFVAFLVVVTATTKLKVSACQFATAITFTKNYGCSSWIDGHLWSLSVEQQFYLLWPAIIALASPRLAALFAICAIAFAPFSRLIEFSAGLPQWWLTSRMDALMCGCLAAMCLGLRPELFRKLVSSRATVARLAGLLGLVAPVIWRHFRPDDVAQVMFGATVQAIAGTALVASLAHGPASIVKSFLNTRPLNFLGLISYSLYIWQEPFFIWPSDFGFSRLVTFEWPFNVIGILVVATASYYCLERPLVLLRKRLSVARS